MGCGGSVPVALTGRDTDCSITLDEARRRREEGAKHRSRRASVMGLLEAEKLKERKLSTPSLQASSVSDMSEITNVKIPTFEPNHSQWPNTSKTSTCVTNMLYPQIEIMISPSSRPGSAGTRDGLDETEMENHDVGQIQDKQKTDQVDIVDLEETEEEILRRKEAEDIVRKAIRSAFSPINAE